LIDIFLEAILSSTDTSDIGEFSATPGVNDDDVQRELQTIWDALRTDPELEKLANELGIPSSQITLQASTPFRASRPEAQFGIAETIMISVAGGVAKSALDALWTRAIWPQLSKRFGADLEPAGDAEQH